jgi:hypothetical protein
VGQVGNVEGADVAEVVIDAGEVRSVRLDGAVYFVLVLAEMSRAGQTPRPSVSSMQTGAGAVAREQGETR